MSQEERYGMRDLTYSQWHRRASTQRFLGWQRATNLTYIDLDAVEYCWKCRGPLILIELARDIGQSNKPTTVLRRLAASAGVPGLLVFYSPNGNDIEQFRVRQVSPQFGQEELLTPKQYAERLWQYRIEHFRQNHPNYFNANSDKF